MGSEVFNLAILLSVKDLASGKLDAASAKIRAFGKEGEASLQKLEKLRAGLNRDFAIGGTGIAGLALIGKGVQVAADFQSAMTDLRATMAQVKQDGQINFDALGKDMQRAEVIAMKLGNELPGTTQDFVQMMQVLKQQGVQAESIFNGTAEAVAHLAVANGQVPKEVAKNYAQFKELYKLKPEQDKAAADTLARLFTSSGINSEELIQATKYFQGRSGSALNITGIEGAQDTLRLFGLLKKQGLEGSEAGTSLNNLFSGYMSARNKNNDPVERLKELEGIDIKLFDEKGKFAGLSNLFKQLEPLQKLSDEKRTGYLKEIFGEEGMSAATAILKTGASGWQQYNQEQNQTISLQEKVSMKQKDFNNQMESLKGSLSNLVVTTFEPMLPSLTDGVKGLNEMVGSVQQFAKENPNLTKTVAILATAGSTALVVYSGFKTLTTGYKMWQLVSSVNSGNLLANLSKVQTQTDAVGTSMNNATNKAKGLRGALSGIGNIAATVTIAYSLNKIDQYLDVAKQAGESQASALKTINEGATVWNNFVKDLASQGKKPTAEDLDFKANTAWFTTMQMGLKEALPSEFQKKPFYSWSQPSQFGTIMKDTVLHPIDWYYGSQNPFAPNFGGMTGGTTYKEGFQKTAPQLADSGVMTAFLRQLTARISNPVERQNVQSGLQQAFPESYAAAIQQLATESGQAAQNISGLSNQINTQENQLNQMGQQQQNARQNFNSLLNPMANTERNFLGLPSPMAKTQQTVTSLGNAANQVPSPLNSLSTSATSASSSLDSLANKIGSFQMPTPQVQTINIPSYQVPQSSLVPNMQSPSIFPSRATGGRVSRGGFVEIHPGEDIIPADVTDSYSGGLGNLSALVNQLERQHSASNPSFPFSPVITVSGGANAAEVRRVIDDALAAGYEQFEARIAYALQEALERA